MTNVETITSGEKINRMQAMKAMERLMITLGGKEGMMAWLAAMPQDAQISPSGGVSTETLMAIAGDQYSYDVVLRAFAKHMQPVLKGIAEVI